MYGASMFCLSSQTSIQAVPKHRRITNAHRASAIGAHALLYSYKVSRRKVCDLKETEPTKCESELAQARATGGCGCTCWSPSMHNLRHPQPLDEIRGCGCTCWSTPSPPTLSPFPPGRCTCSCNKCPNLNIQKARSVPQR
jgi:hypothetical protein